jgi:hypothetical protein
MSLGVVILACIVSALRKNVNAAVTKPTQIPQKITQTRINIHQDLTSSPKHLTILS